MHERHKIKEAHFFLGRMESAVLTPDVFPYFLSAFLSAARSVLQYALEEVRSKPGGQAWYDGRVAVDAILKFFKDKRDVNIHVEPMVLNREIAVTDTARIAISESVVLTIHRADGSVEKREIKNEPAAALIEESPSTIRVKFRFADWPGSEDVVALAKAYISRLEVFVNTGIQGQWITG